MRLDKTKIFDTETISARAMTLQTTSHGLNLDNPLAYELALYHVRFRGVEYTTFCSWKKNGALCTQSITDTKLNDENQPN